MDYLQIGDLSFERNASKSDMRLDFCSSFQEAALDCGDLAFDTMEAEVFTKTAGLQLVASSANIPIIVYRDNEVYARFAKLTVSRIAPNSYRITGRSPMGVLTAITHVGGIYTGQTANDIITEICGSIPVLVESVYSSKNIYGWLPYADGKEKSARDNLAQVLFAIGAYLRTDLNGVLRIEKALGGTASLIPADRSYSGGTVDYASPVSSVSVTEHQYIAGADEKTLFSGTTQAGDIVTFSEPMHSLTATGFTILESNANYAKLSAGTGTLTGKTYTHNTRLVTRTVTEGAAENIVSVSDATLVSLVNSAAVADRLAEYYKHREVISNGVIAGAEKPGHVVSIYHPYDKKMVSACIESLDTTMSATIKSNLSALVGFRPPQPEEAEYYDEAVILTGSGSWSPPEGVTRIRAVLIGGGTGGQAGYPGSPSATQSLREESTTLSSGKAQDRRYVTWVEGGDGGEPGAAGLGGKVLEAEVDVSSGDAIAYACGSGGLGGAYTSGAETQPTGADGSDTTFGALSSATGSRSEGGYVDVTSGTRYADAGAEGVSGSKGAYRKLKDGGEPFGFSDGWEPVASPPIVVGDITYTPGADGGRMDAYAGPEDASGSRGRGFSRYCWASGGGAAYGANGGDGQDGSVTADIVSSAIHVRTIPGRGGAGANALPPPDAAGYGKGGTGGNGGGGGGSPSYAAAGWTHTSSANPADLSVAGLDNAPGPGGSGSDGGRGGDGCILIFYRRYRTVQPGWVKDANGKYLLDRLNRRIIV